MGGEVAAKGDKIDIVAGPTILLQQSSAGCIWEDL